VGGRTRLEFLIDTGADVSVITEEAWGRLGVGLRPHEKVLSGAGGHRLEVLGEIVTSLRKRDGKKTGATLVVVKGARVNLLGRPEITRLGMVNVVGSVNASAEFPGLFGSLGQMKTKFTIRLQEGATPYRLDVPRRLALGLREATKQELDRMLEAGVIRRVDGPRDWCSGMVVAPKKGGQVRICVDLTNLNKWVRREAYPLPRVDDLLAELGKSRVFSKMDANSGFWQIPLDHQSQKLTCFITPFGRYEFLKMPFGICSAPEKFQREMNGILGDVDGVVCMMDDILVHAEDMDKHDNTLREVLARLERAGVTLNEGKCEFATRKVNFLGHVVSEGGISPDPAKVEAIVGLRAPTCRKELKSFLGMVGYLAKFSPRLAGLERSLRDLVRKDREWAWGERQWRDFEEIKKELTKAPTLAKFDVRANHRVTADASRHSLGAALLQRTGAGDWRPVAYLSRSLTEEERNYAQIRKRHWQSRGEGLRGGDGPQTPCEPLGA
jgi:hypothetical protein